MNASRLGNSLTGGWVRLYRSVITGGWIKNHHLFIFWCYCLMKASHKEHRLFVGHQQITLQPGQFVFGRKTASDETGLTEQNIRTCLHSLETSGNLTIKATNKFSIITVENWGIYQSNDERATNKATNGQPATNQQLTTNKNDKKGKKEKNPPDPRVRELISFYSEAFQIAFKGKPSITGKEAAAVKNLLGQHTIDELQEHIKVYLGCDDGFYQKQGYSLSFLGKFIQAKKCGAYQKTEGKRLSAAGQKLEYL